MSLTVIGTSHHTAPVEVRERFAFGPEEVTDALAEIRARSGIDEVVLVSTCNRTELYLYPLLGENTAHQVEAFLQRKAGPLPGPVGDFLYRYRGEDVARHLFRVASGLDSLVTGEAEIQGQVREAYQRALEPEGMEPFSGVVLNRLFQTALSIGGRVRSETRIAQGAASVASVAVELARKIFGRLTGKRVLVIGAGEASELVVQALGREGVTDVTVANRTHARAADLAERLRGRAIQLAEIHRALSRTDIVVSSTGAPHALVTRNTLAQAFPGGLDRPLLFVDIAIPRDVAPEVGDNRRVFLYNVDDLRQIVDENLAKRRDVLDDAEAIVREGADEFEGWFQTLEVVPTIRRLRGRAEEVRRQEMERIAGKLEGVDPSVRAEVEALSRRLVNKLLHEPTVRIRDGAAAGRGEDVLRAFGLLFGFNAPTACDEERGGAKVAADETDSEGDEG
ncbi:MAG: glutamyl-tRNA reductase [Gemmatimonadota bacterium]